MINRMACKLTQELLFSPDFYRFQNDIVLRVHKALNMSYRNKDNEVSMVTDLCKCLNGLSFGPLAVHAKKIHGSTSIVRFINASNNSVDKELSDMVIISLATLGEKIVFQKMAFIQNKKESPGVSVRWSIDQDQLFLLHNFPTFDSVTGFLGTRSNVVLPNIYGNLGNYGLFYATGDMVFANARVVNALQKNTSLSLEKLRGETAGKRCACIVHPWHLLGCKSLYCQLHKVIGCFYIPETPFLGNCDIALNIYQFVRNWTQFNIGEVTVFNGEVVNSTLASLAEYFIKSVGLDKKFNFKDVKDEKGYEHVVEFGGAVLVLHHKMAV